MNKNNELLVAQIRWFYLITKGLNMYSTIWNWEISAMDANLLTAYLQLQNVNKLKTMRKASFNKMIKQKWMNTDSGILTVFHKTEKRWVRIGIVELLKDKPYMYINFSQDEDLPHNSLNIECPLHIEFDGALYLNLFQQFMQCKTQNDFKKLDKKLDQINKSN